MCLASIFKRLRNLGQKDCGESKREQDGGPKDGAVALPAPPSTANVQPQSSEQGDVGDSTKPSSNVTESRAPFSNLPVTDAGVVTPPAADAAVKEPHQPVTTSTQETPDGPKPGAEESQPATEYPDLSTSQKIWNRAYEDLEKDNGAKGLVDSYMITLTAFLKAKKAPDTSASGASDVLAELNDPIKREIHREEFVKLDEPIKREMHIAELVKSYMTYKKAPDTSASGAINISDELKDPIKGRMDMEELVEEGLKKVSMAMKIAKGVGVVPEFILSAKEVIDPAIGNIPQAALPWAGICVGLQILSNPAKAIKSNLAGITHIVSTMDWYCALTEHLLNKKNNMVGEESFEPIQQQLEDRVIELYKALLLYQMKSVCSYYGNQGVNFLRGFVDPGGWDRDLKCVTDAEDALQKYSEKYIELHAVSQFRDIRQKLLDLIAQQKEMHMDDKDTECLQNLRVVNPREDMKKIENKKEALLDDAYKWILDTKEYAAFTNSSALLPCRLLWVKGHAGTGKTMLLIGIIRKLSVQPFTSLSYFFCQGADNKTLNNATAILRSLIWLLLKQQPHLISHLRDKYKESGPALFTGDAFNALSEPFQNMLKDPRLLPVYFVVDALDECDQGLEDLFRLILTSLKLSSRVKWLVSSRPEVDVLATLKDLDAKNPDTVGTPLELDAQSQEDAVNAYIEHKLSTLEGRAGYDKDILTSVQNEIRQRAEKTFLWVSLVFKELDRKDKRLKLVDGAYALVIIKNLPSGLVPLYDHMMGRINDGMMRDPEYCKNVLVATSHAYRALSLLELAVLAGLPSKMNPKTIVDKCGSFLTIKRDPTTKEETVYLIHQSAKEYLDMKHKSGLQQRGTVQGHANISRRSINAMSTLKRNIYDLPWEHAGVESKDITPPDPDPLAPIRYSCVFWLDHLHDANGQSSELPDDEAILVFPKLPDDVTILAFLKKHFLHWLESLSLLGKLPKGVLSIRKLLDVAQPTSDLARFLKDVKKFALSYESIIEQAPLQTYGAALAFCPTETEVKRQYWGERLQFIKTVTGIRDDWDPCFQTLEGHSSWVSAVAFSPDGNTVASVSEDGTVRLWDVMTGAHQQMLKGHSSWVRAVAFSPDSKTIASASSDGTVRLWDVATGAHQHILKGHSSWVRAVAFSPVKTVKTVASASDDGTIRLWDAATGAPQQTLEGHSGCVRAVAFSPDSKTIASASDDGTVRLWNVVTGAPQQTLEGHSGYVRAVTFSPDGKTVASASDDSTVRLWDAATGSRQQTLEGHSGYVRAVAFSPDKTVKRVASASSDGTVRLWDAATGSKRVLGHRRWVRAVAFSPDGETVASASDDGTVRLWDAATGAQTLRGHSSCVRAVTFSPDGKTVASASSDSTVRLWDAATGSRQRTIEGHSGYVRAVAFSPDGETVASASNDGTVRLWGAATGAPQRTLRGHSSWVKAVAFSPDSKTVMSASYDGTVRHWDVVTGAPQRPLEGHSDSVRIVGFSPDGKTVASASENATVRLWDTVTGTTQQTFRGHSRYVRAVAFLPDGKTIASASDDGTVRLWDVATGARQQTLRGHSGYVKAVAFSPDGETVASASSDRTVRLWNAAMGTHQTLEGHSSWVMAVVFSPNGKTIASASDDGTVRLWDAATGTPQRTLKGHSGYVKDVAFSPDGKTIVSASYDRTVRFWDAATGAHQQTLNHSSWVRAAAFSPDGNTVASASQDGTVWVWDAVTGAPQQTLKGHSSYVKAVAFSPDGKTIASASYDGAVWLWDAATDVYQQTLNIDQCLTRLSLSEDGGDSYGTCLDQKLSDCAVFIRDDWVTRDGKDLLWLPPDYRATCTAMYGNALVLGHASGQVTFVRFVFS